MPIAIDRLVRSRRKTLTLLVRPDGSLEVRAPLGIADASIRSFVERHASWIDRQQQRARRAPAAQPRQFAEGQEFLYLGQAYPLLIAARQRVSLAFDGRNFRLSKKALPNARQAFIEWYRSRARTTIASRIDSLARQFGFKHHKLRISSARTRWGSCSSKGTLSFSYRLIMAPPAIVDYVIIHELVHLEIQNHSQQFWKRVAEIMPEYPQQRAWLRKNGRQLYL